MDVGVAIKHKRDPDVAELGQPFERRARHVFADVQPTDGGGREGALPWAAAAVDEERAGKGDGGEGEDGETVGGGGCGGSGGRMVGVLLLLCSCVVGQLTFGRRASFAFGGEERGEALDGGGGGVLAMMVVDAVGDDAGQGGGGGGHDRGSGGRHGSCRSNGFVQPM